jgi:uncharacterized membrane protein YedE/YeeE
VGDSVRRAALFLLIAGAAVAVGFGLGMVVIVMWGVVQGPFQPAWDDTWRERVPVGLAYLIWGATIIGGLVLGWRIARAR